MGEADAIAAVDEPITVVSLVEDLEDLGVKPGETLLVHSSLSSLGWVCGDAPAVVDALMEILTESGTLVMPMFTSQYSDPAGWQRPPVPNGWVETIRQMRPPFRPALTPSRGVGAIPECFRTYPGVLRSRHPLYSFAAWGEDADEIVRNHPYNQGLGDGSPLGRIYGAQGSVLMLGTDYETNSSLHLAEFRSETWDEAVTTSVPIERNGERESVDIEEVEWSTEGFASLGEAFEGSYGAKKGTVGGADASLIDQPTLVDFAVEWFNQNR